MLQITYCGAIALSTKAAGLLTASLRKLEEDLQREQDVLELQATTLRTVVEAAVNDIGQCLWLMEVHQQLPQEEIRRLAVTRRHLTELIEVARSTKSTVADAAMTAVSNSTAGSDVNPVDRRVESTVINQVRETLGLCRNPSKSQ